MALSDERSSDPMTDDANLYSEMEELDGDEQQSRQATINLVGQ